MYIHQWTGPGWLKQALDAAPKAVVSSFESICQRLDLTSALGAGESVNGETQAAAPTAGSVLLTKLLGSLAEASKKAIALDGTGEADTLASEWQQLQGLWSAADASGFATAEVDAIGSLLKLGEATLSDEVAIARGKMDDSDHRAAPDMVVAHPALRAFWRRNFHAEKVTWQRFWEAFPASLGEELELNPEGPLGLGGLMGDEETSSNFRAAVEAYTAQGMRMPAQARLVMCIHKGKAVGRWGLAGVR